MASTLIPDVKAALVDMLGDAMEAAGEGFEEVLVTLDSEPTRSSEFVWVGRAKAEREFHGVARRPQARLAEEVEVEIQIMSIGGTSSSLTSESRAFEILEIVENAIRDEIRLGLGDYVRQSIVSEVDGRPLMFDQKRAFEIKAKVLSGAVI